MVSLCTARLIQLETLNYSQAAFIGRVSVAPFSRDEHGNTQCLFYSLLGNLPESLLMLIDRSVVYYNINRMLYMAIKTKYKRSYRETLTGPMKAAAAWKPRGGEKLGGLLGASKEGYFLDFLKLNTGTARNVACACLEYLTAADCTVGHHVCVSKSVRWITSQIPFPNIEWRASNVEQQTAEGKEEEFMIRRG